MLSRKCCATIRGISFATAMKQLQRSREAGELVWNDLESLLNGKFLRTLPGVQPCDGFFAAVIEKIG